MALSVSTNERVELVDISDRVAGELPSDATGICTVFCTHTSAGLLIQENESRLKRDLLGLLERVVPEAGGYEHDEIDDNADAHLRATLLDSSLSIPVKNGALQLGTWQTIFLVECDGPRTRNIIVTVT
ncbi:MULTISPECIES: secondary thiamine-phosphate synthase enzyme YjbQ [unclassified Haladaptatus]|uniref:secondary thiamine-phosphate synthase enzyme YjbQ n=1 Tax=unclassified Haladaptatus TaxID=2622732 RepID=UPI0023E7DD9C|nr:MULTISPECIES: secondary thiamine-phosphate synthase enzyme YjbQ [unclassified Haladaptatus]